MEWVEAAWVTFSWPVGRRSISWWHHCTDTAHFRLVAFHWRPPSEIRLEPAFSSCCCRQSAVPGSSRVGRWGSRRWRSWWDCTECTIQTDGRMVAVECCRVLAWTVFDMVDRRWRQLTALRIGEPTMTTWSLSIVASASAVEHTKRALLRLPLRLNLRGSEHHWKEEGKGLT